MSNATDPTLFTTARRALVRVCAVMALACGTVALSACGTAPATGSAAADAAAQMKVTVVVDSTSVDSPVSYDEQVALEEGATVLDALEALATQEDFSYNMTDSAYGAYVSAIDGLAEREHGDQSGWTYTVNGEMVSDAASDCVLSEGDSVEWTYVTEW